ncbi:hypothetical protein SLEP1_g17188 [Rubroshorea leprosula]|uniref:Uncharacterized protein n=1 Tax=Rubroshorea leprosula TaxID=152421 RepID=A0AAV5J2J5_9ROSI|nr:hypothetical protein SLEP1_g17188 [Rubroshorea leprosula]
MARKAVHARPAPTLYVVSMVVLGLARLLFFSTLGTSGWRSDEVVLSCGDRAGGCGCKGGVSGGACDHA